MKAGLRFWIRITMATLLATSTNMLFAQEYDDLYFNAKDRKSKEVVTAKVDESAASQQVLEEYENNAYDGSSYSARNLNPELLAKYNNGQDDEVIEDESAEYFREDYQSERFNEAGNRNNRYYNDAPVVNNYYGGFPGFCTMNPYAGFNTGPRVSVGMGFGTGFYRPSYSVSVMYGSGFYDPFYDPFYSPWSYRSAFYDPYFYGYRYGGFYRPYYGGYYSAYNRGLYRGYYLGSNAGGEVKYYKGGREVVRGARSGRTARETVVTGRGNNADRIRENGDGQRQYDRAPISTTRGRTRVSTDIAGSQNELNTGRSRTTSSTRSRNAVNTSRSRSAGSIDRSAYSNGSRSSSRSYSTRSRSSEYSTRSRQSNSSNSGYQRNYKTNTNNRSRSNSSYGTRSRSNNSGFDLGNLGGGSRSRSYGGSSGGSRSRTLGTGGSRSRSSGGSSRTRSRSNN